MSDKDVPFKFSSIQQTEEFNGHGNDADRFVPPPKEEGGKKVNKYGVRERTSQKRVLEDDDEIQFSVNRG